MPLLNFQMVIGQFCFFIFERGDIGQNDICNLYIDDFCMRRMLFPK